MRPLKPAQGAALLTALFIMTLVAIVATAMTTRLQLDIYRTQLIVNQDKLYLASQAVRFWAQGELSKIKNKYTKSYKLGLVARYPKTMQNLVEHVVVSGEIYDLQARFNLNNCQEKKALAVFVTLLEQINSLESQQRVKLAQALQDWLSTYDLARGKDNYLSYYLAQKPPYYPSHQAMSSVSELRLVKDISAPIFEGLQPFITALPEITSININTATKKVLASLGNGLNDAQVNELIIARGEQGIKDFKDIAELIKKLNLPKEQITINSTYFLSVAYATNPESKLIVYTLLKRSVDKNRKIIVNIIRESMGNF